MNKQNHFVKDEHINGDNDWAQAPPFTSDQMDFQTRHRIQSISKEAADFIPGVTMPTDVPIGGNLSAWDDYCATLAWHQLKAQDYNNNYHHHYRTCINYFRATWQKMNIFRLLYLHNHVKQVCKKSTLITDLGLSRQTVYSTIKECEEADYVEVTKHGVTLTQHAFDAFRCYSVNWWNANVETGLSAQFFRVFHSRIGVNVKDIIRNELRQNNQ